MVYQLRRGEGAVVKGPSGWEMGFQDSHVPQREANRAPEVGTRARPTESSKEGRKFYNWPS